MVNQLPENTQEEWKKFRQQLHNLGHWDDEGWYLSDSDDLEDLFRTHLSQAREQGRREGIKETGEALLERIAKLESKESKIV